MRQKTVLLVNETAASESLAQALRQEGFIVISASDEHEALAVFEADKIDLILLDVDLGNKNGWTSFKRLADCVPVVVIRAAEFQAAVEKPFSFPALFSFLPRARACREQAAQISLRLSDRCPSSAQFRTSAHTSANGSAQPQTPPTVPAHRNE